MKLRNNDELARYKEKNGKDKIILFPPAGLFDNGYVMAVIEVWLDTNLPEGAFATTDLWSFNKKDWVLTKHGLDKISRSAGIKFTDTRPILKETDPDTKRATYVKHQVWYQRLSTTGAFENGTATGEYSYYEDVARLRYKKDVVYNGKTVSKKGDPILEQIEKRRNYSGSLAESNAKIRAFAEAISELPKSFNIEELKKKPIVVAQTIVDIEGLLRGNPELQQAYAVKMLGLGDMVYGAPMNNQILIDQRSMSGSILPPAPDLNLLSPSKDEQPPQEEIKTEELTDQQLETEIEDCIKKTGYKGKALKTWQSFDRQTKIDFLSTLKSKVA